MFERFDTLLQLEMSEIFLYDVGHGHAQCGGKVLHRHRVLFFGICQKAK